MLHRSELIALQRSEHMQRPMFQDSGHRGTSGSAQTPKDEIFPRPKLPPREPQVYKEKATHETARLAPRAALESTPSPPGMRSLLWVFSYLVGRGS